MVRSSQSPQGGGGGGGCEARKKGEGRVIRGEAKGRQGERGGGLIGEEEGGVRGRGGGRIVQQVNLFQHSQTQCGNESAPRALNTPPNKAAKTAMANNAQLVP